MESKGSNKRQRTEDESTVYIVHWARESFVSDWDQAMLATVETCSDTIGNGEAMTYVTDPDDEDAMLNEDGLRQERSVYSKAYMSKSLAEQGLLECFEKEKDRMRTAIRKICGISKQGYKQMLETDEICEYPNGGMELIPDSSAETTIAGEETYQIAWGTNSLYDQDKAHKYLHLCTEILTRLACWVEKLELVREKE